MRTYLNRSFLLLFVAWFLAANVGFSWTQSTCLFTGIQKAAWTIHKPIHKSQQTQFKRSTCFHFKHFQVKQHSVFSFKKHSSWQDCALVKCPEPSHSRIKMVFADKVVYHAASVPMPHALRRAFLQVYLI